jgi:hypothetical protein
MNVMNGIQLNIDAYTYYDYLKYAILLLPLLDMN